MVDTRKKAFQPAIGALDSISATTMKPVMMPTRLMTTCTNVNVSSDIPRIMAYSSCDGELYRIEAATDKSFPRRNAWQIWSSPDLPSIAARERLICRSLDAVKFAVTAGVRHDPGYVARDVHVRACRHQPGRHHDRLHRRGADAVERADRGLECLLSRVDHPDQRHRLLLSFRQGADAGAHRRRDLAGDPGRGAVRPLRPKARRP